jgi:flagellar secretion chaperone FliS
VEAKAIARDSRKNTIRLESPESRSLIFMSSYQEHALDGASAIDLVVALYDGILRFLYAAIAAVERGDETGRRIAVKRALEIIIHLQARLRMDVGGRPAQALSEFYASVFAQILQASQSASRQKFEHAIECVKNVRDAWREVARNPEGKAELPRVSVLSSERGQPVPESSNAEAAVAARWTA